MAAAFPALMVLDGGFGTELERRGADVRGALWSAEALLGSPDLVEDVHAAYLAAGSDCITTGSYQVSFEGFAEAGLTAAHTISALKGSMAIADAARRRFEQTTRRRALVAGSLGPYGAMLHNGAEYHGRYGISERELVAFHRSRLEHLQDGPVDLIACETVPSLQEAAAMLRALSIAGRYHCRRISALQKYPLRSRRTRRRWQPSMQSLLYGRFRLRDSWVR